MHNDQLSLFARPDTFFGVCEGLSQDLGIHGNILRLAFAGFFFWNPAAAIATYAALGLVVLVSRLLFPAGRRSSAAAMELAAQPQPAEPKQEAEAHPELPLAA
ncbi:MAG TPA: PspC domain-containing protein [Allosphingosinicella sp.]|nr:PspC domain-containing protein [Allosphingosinicella sp.]